MSAEDTAWIQTYSGVRFSLLEPTKEMFVLEDIAHSLAFTTRFNGHLSRYYSVAEHCIHVASLLPEEYALHGLLHEIGEPYVGDMVSPLKQLIPDFKVIEKRIEAVGFAAFGLAMPMPPEVKAADLALMVAEKQALFLHPRKHEWELERDGFVPPKINFHCYTPYAAEAAFLTAFRRYTYGLNN